MDGVTDMGEPELFIRVLTLQHSHPILLAEAADIVGQEREGLHVE